MASLYNIGSFDNPVYLFGTSGNWSLIEGGISAQYGQVKKQLSQLVSNWSDIKSWFILHSHFDHCGLLPYLYPELEGVQVYAGAKTQLNFRKEKSIQVIEQLNTHLSKTKGELSGLHEIAQTPIPSIPIHRLEQGDLIPCGNAMNFVVLETPGHSDCSISLFEEKSGQLFVSDALGEYFSPKEWFPLAFYELGDYLDSIETLKHYVPQSIALGHSECIRGAEVKMAFQYSTEATHRLIDQVKKQLQTQSESAIALELHQQYAYHSASFVSQKLHQLSMQRLVSLIKDF